MVSTSAVLDILKIQKGEFKVRNIGIVKRSAFLFASELGDLFLDLSTVSNLDDI